jgi:hypothetical protein
MPIFDNDDFASDEPSFDIGWSIDPAGASGDTLDEVVGIINGMQDRVDGGVKSQIAQIQTAINLLQNRLRTDLQQRIDLPSASLIQLQERIAVDSAGRMADIGERFNGFISQIASWDDAVLRCRQRCVTAYQQCHDQPDNVDFSRESECEILLWECVQSCLAASDPGRVPPTTPWLPGDDSGTIDPPEGVPGLFMPPDTISVGGGGEPEIGWKPGDPHIMPGGPELTRPPSAPGTQVPPDFEIDPGGFTSDKRACLLPDMSGVSVWQVGPFEYYVDDGSIHFPSPTTADGIGVGVWEKLPNLFANTQNDKDLWIRVLVPCEPGEQDCVKIGPQGWFMPQVYKGKCQPVLLPMEPVWPEPELGPGGMCCPPTNYGCRLYFDCKTYEVYGILVPDGSQPTPRHNDDIAIGSSGITEDQFKGMIRACGGFDPGLEVGPGSPLPEGIDKISYCLELTAGAVIENIMKDPGTLCAMLGFVKDDDGSIRDPDWIEQLNFPNDVLARALLMPIKFVCQWLNDNVDKWLRLIDCFGPGMKDIIGTRIVLSIVSLITGRALSNWDLSLEQQANFKCPVAVPSAGNAIVAFLANNISEDVAKCWVQANNFHWDDFKHVVNASRSKLGVNELIQLRLRKEISDVEMSDRVRELGFLDTDEPDEFLELSKWVPGPADLIRWMVRDVEDVAIVARFNLDADFNAKFAGQVEKYAEWQNIDKQDMLRFWRAHWTIPGPHQLHEMYHRLRYPFIPANERVSRADIETALKQQDIAPFWVDRIIAVAFKPLTRVDVRRAYRIGSINRPQVEQAYKELGYSDANAAILGDFAEQLVKNTWIKSPLIGRYVKGEINQGELNNLAIQEGALPALIPDMITRGDALRDADTRGKCITSLHKRYMEAEFTPAQALAEVTLIGVDPVVANSLVDAWQCELVAAGKHAPASTLCGWWQDGIIDTAEFYDRLINLGYENDLALNFLAQCEIKLDRKIATIEKQRIKQIEAENKRVRKEAEKQAKQVDRDRKKRETATDKMRKTRQRREDILVESAKRLANRLDDDIVMTMREVKATNASMKSLMSWTEAAIVQSIAQASQVKEIANLAEFQPIVLGILSERPVGSLSGNGNGNGSS